MPRRRSTKIAAAIALATMGAASNAAQLSSYQAEQTLRALLVASPFRIPDRATIGTIRYRLTLADGPAWRWPETHEQHVEHVDGATVLTICADCGRETPPSTEKLARYLAPNAWVQSRDFRVVEFARGARRASTAATMHALVDAVQKHMTGAIDFHDYATATQALESRSGDCTEFAVLLAAAARARGIPTRIVGGLSYASRFLGRTHAFSPHLWVQAWDGARWTSYDAALGRFDSTHIAIAIGDGTPQSMAGVMDVIARLRIADAAAIVVDGNVADAAR